MNNAFVLFALVLPPVLPFNLRLCPSALFHVLLFPFCPSAFLFCSFCLPIFVLLLLVIYHCSLHSSFASLPTPNLTNGLSVSRAVPETLCFVPERRKVIIRYKRNALLARSSNDETLKESRSNRDFQILIPCLFEHI